MAKNLTPDLKRKAIALFVLIGTLLWQSTYTQVAFILLSALIGFLLFKEQEDSEEKTSIPFPISRGFASICLVLFFALLFCYLF